MFYLIDKPVGMTSFDVIRVLRKKLGIKKMWHIGTLDPLASGLILIATEQSTKLLSLLNSNKKTYRFTVSLDGFSESLDMGEEIQKIDISKRKIPNAETLKKFLESQTEQIPPKFSALHINGKRAYELARNGENFSLPKRQISVSEVEILEIFPEKISARLTISSGGYIRSFAPLIGEFCNINGGYISFLRREKLHIWNIFLDESQAQNLENFDEKNFISEKELFPEFLHIFSENFSLQKKLQDGIIPDEIENFFPEKPKNNQHILLTFENFSSLLQKKDEKILLVRNNIISSSHKNHTK